MIVVALGVTIIPEFCALSPKLCHPETSLLLIVVDLGITVIPGFCASSSKLCYLETSPSDDCSSPKHHHDT